MSRIHEALKKAEQDRAASLSPGAAAMPLTPMVPAGPVPGETLSTAPANLAISQSGGMSTSQLFLRLEDLQARCARREWKIDGNQVVFDGEGHSNLAAEQFRTLRSRLYRLSEKRPLRRLLITSALPAEGKSFVATNLALAIVRQRSRRVLLIDGDLRSSKLHVALGTSSGPGLTDYLRGEVDEYAVLQWSAQENLFFIPAGRPVSNPAELLGDVRWKHLLERLTPVFDWIIVDSPPTMLLADAGLLAELCDGVLMVVRAGSTPSDVAQKACQEYREKNLVGVVLNRTEDVSGYGGYSYYSGDGKDKR